MSRESTVAVRMQLIRWRQSGVDCKREAHRLQCGCVQQCSSSDRDRVWHVPNVQSTIIVTSQPVVKSRTNLHILACKFAYLCMQICISWHANLHHSLSVVSWLNFALYESERVEPCPVSQQLQCECSLSGGASRVWTVSVKHTGCSAAVCSNVRRVTVTVCGTCPMCRVLS